VSWISSLCPRLCDDEAIKSKAVSSIHQGLERVRSVEPRMCSSPPGDLEVPDLPVCPSRGDLDLGDRHTVCCTSSKICMCACVSVCIDVSGQAYAGPRLAVARQPESNRLSHSGKRYEEESHGRQPAFDRRHQRASEARTRARRDRRGETRLLTTRRISARTRKASLTSE